MCYCLGFTGAQTTTSCKLIQQCDAGKGQEWATTIGQKVEKLIPKTEIQLIFEDQCFNVQLDFLLD